jgi:hypothetical protein
MDGKGSVKWNVKSASNFGLFETAPSILNFRKQ